MVMHLPKELEAQLEKAAKERRLSVGDFLRDRLKRYAAERETDDKQWATLADMARHAKKLNMASPEPVNTAERSREILNTEYADYLKSRIDP